MCVLLVEDEFLIRSIMSESLRDEGFEVCDVGSAEEAMAAIDQPPESFTVLVTDVHLSGETTGIHIAESMRRRWPNVPVIVATGRPDALTTEERRAKGYVLLRKPYGPRELAATIRQAVADAEQSGPAPRDPA